MCLSSTCLNLHMLDSSNPSFLYKYQILPKVGIWPICRLISSVHVCMYRSYQCPVFISYMYCFYVLYVPVFISYICLCLCPICTVFMSYMYLCLCPIYVCVYVLYVLCLCPICTCSNWCTSDNLSPSFFCTYHRSPFQQSHGYLAFSF